MADKDKSGIFDVRETGAPSKDPVVLTTFREPANAMHRHKNQRHHHSHTDVLPESSKRIAWAFFLNFGFSIIEFIGGILTNSTAIMADAVHDLGDSLSIGIAWLLDRLSKRPVSSTYSYGYKRFSLLGAMITGIVLTAGSIWVLLEAVPRLTEPEMPVAEGMFAMALFGIGVNGFAAYKLSDGKTLNERMLNWHLLEDVLGWVAVLVVSVVLMFLHWPILDPLLSIGFTLFILFNVIRTLWQTLRIFLQAVPDQALEIAIRNKLRASALFNKFHHLHIWSLDGEHHVLTVHIVLDQDLDILETQPLKAQLAELLAEFSIAHSTVEFEFDNETCRDCRSAH